MWQDYIFSAGSIVFCIALLPTVFGKAKPPLLTSAPTAVILLVFAATYASLDLWFSFAAATLTAVLWAIVAVQTIKNRKVAN